MKLIKEGDGDKMANDHRIKEPGNSSSGLSLIPKTQSQTIEPRKLSQNFDSNMDPQKLKR